VAESTAWAELQTLPELGTLVPMVRPAKREASAAAAAAGKALAVVAEALPLAARAAPAAPAPLVPRGA
jgi:hypothetical protein